MMGLLSGSWYLLNAYLLLHSLCKVSCYSCLQFHEGSTVPILQVIKLKLRKKSDRRPTAGKWQNWNSKAYLSDSGYHMTLGIMTTMRWRHKEALVRQRERGEEKNDWKVGVRRTRNSLSGKTVSGSLRGEWNFESEKEEHSQCRAQQEPRASDRSAQDTCCSGESRHSRLSLSSLFKMNKTIKINVMLVY